jgi:hypothetical protein
MLTEKIRIAEATIQQKKTVKAGFEQFARIVWK